MTFTVKDSGLFSTVQDLGRTGYQSLGFSPAGALDYRSHYLANQLLGNDPDDAVIEMTFQGMILAVKKDTVIATAGSNMIFTINGVPCQVGMAVNVFKGDEIFFGRTQDGARTYMAVLGGVDVPEILNSRSTHTRSGIGGHNGRQFKPGDVIKPLDGEFSGEYKEIKAIEEDTGIRVIAGQQYDYFTDTAKAALVENGYKISKDSDRMGFRLNGETLESSSGHDVLSEPTQLGSIQVPKNGQPIILLNDRQTAGGYTRIATVIQSDIPKLVQMSPGETITFSLVSVEEATELYKEELQNLKDGSYLQPSTDFTSMRRKEAHKISELMRS